MDFIVGEKFCNIGDFIFSTNDFEDFNKLENTFNINKLKDINIVYLHTMYKDIFFNIIKNLNNKFIVVTHNCDKNINDVNNLPDNVIKWYSQNVNCKNDRLFSIPIGLENSKWFTHLHKQDKILRKVNEQKNFKNLVYINHNIRTNIKERTIPYELLKDKSYATIEFGSNGENFDNYLDNIYNHKFVICPEGNGIDTHRKWETLYLNSIPIEKRNINNSFYEDLPICFVDSWKEITEDFLNKEYLRITNTKWNLNKLNMFYWQNEIYKI